MNQKFIKLEGLGNDFVLIDCRRNNLRLTCDQIKKIGERRFGIGCDQILVLEPPTNKNADFLYVVFNSDGSRSEHCGNGLRCVGAYFRKFYKQEDYVTAQMGSDTYVIRFLRNDLYSIEFDPPIFQPREIGLNNTEISDKYFCEIRDKSIGFGAVSLGNPHAVIEVDKPVKESAEIYGSRFQEKGLFQNGVNVGFFRVIDKAAIELSVWERGVGYTPACGTGACAAVAVGQKWGLLDLRVKVVQEGGIIEIIADEIGGRFTMVGPANYVFTGNIDI